MIPRNDDDTTPSETPHASPVVVSGNSQESVRESLTGDENAPMTGADVIKRFLFGGSALFTLVSADSRYTYKVTQARNKVTRKVEPGRFLVGMLSGPDNTADYRFLGFLADGVLSAPRRNEGTRAFAALSWLLGELRNGSDGRSRLEFWHAGRCGMRGRVLTVPESISTGIGPVCAGRAS